MGICRVMEKLPDEKSLPAQPRPYVNHSVELKKPFTAEERAAMLESVGLNVFFFPSEMITGCDLLSDSGTTTMTNEQWAALHLGDEAYGSNRGYFELLDVIGETFGKEFTEHAFLFHQGRPCEDALFTMLAKEGEDMVIPSNGHFDTTEANIEANRIEARNLFSPELKDPNSTSRFKGDMDVARLEQLLDSGENVPLAYLTVTNNAGGGQPVSLENIRGVSELVHQHDVPLFLDACRFAENAWFIRQHEHPEMTIPEIVREMFSYADGFTISFKKDGLVNMGGGLFLRDKGKFIEKYPHIPDALTNHQILKEGHPTYGGMSGRDIMALAVGLKAVVREDYLDHRIKQVQAFGQRMIDLGIPVLAPIGGHAVYLDVNKFFEDTDLKPEDFGGISLTALLLAGYGHRACELGNFAFGSYDPDTGVESYPEVNFMRFAVPRLRYEQQDLDSVAEAVKALYDHRHEIPGIEVTYGRELSLRHFKARFRFKS